MLATLVFSSCEILWRKVVDKTATISYFAEKFGDHTNKVYPRTCYKRDLEYFRRGYREYVPKPERNKALEKVKHERNRLFISTIDSYKPQMFLASNIEFILVDSKDNVIKNQTFMYQKEVFTYDADGWLQKFYRYNYLFVLDEVLSRKSMEKERWPVFLTVKFPDGKFIKYKIH